MFYRLEFVTPKFLMQIWYFAKRWWKNRKFSLFIFSHKQTGKIVLIFLGFLSNRYVEKFNLVFVSSKDCLKKRHTYFRIGWLLIRTLFCPPWWMLKEVFECCINVYRQKSFNLRKFRHLAYMFFAWLYCCSKNLFRFWRMLWCYKKFRCSSIFNTAVMTCFWARVLRSLAAEEASFRMRITLGVVLIRSLVFHVCVPECSRNGFGIRLYLLVRENFV